MKELVVLIVAFFFTGCSTLSGPEPSPFCGDGSRVSKPKQWQITGEPSNAESLRSLANSSKSFPGGTAYPIEHWFSAPTGELMLCRRDKSSCSGEWWEFQQANGGPIISNQDAWVCVTGVRPNDSFKPMPLRGTA